MSPRRQLDRESRIARFTATCIALLLASCGARSELRVPHRDATVDTTDAADSADMIPRDVDLDGMGLCLHVGGTPPRDGSVTDPTASQCHGDVDCRGHGADRFCDVATMRCVGCRSNTDCDGGSVCAMGRCTTRCNGDAQCFMGQTCCGRFCVDTTDDPFNCGMCGNNCAGECIGGLCMAACTAGCPSGENCCGARCRNLQRDPAACGGCGIVCPDGTQCVAGSCVASTCATPCATEQSCCDDRCFNLDADNEHCGSCANRCADGETCSSGTCVAPCGSTRCAHGQICCGSDCADTTNDPLNCGGCHHVCGIGEACIASICTHVGTLGQYTVSSSMQPFVDACSVSGRAVYLQNADDATVTFDLPFPLRFFGCDDTAVWISSNGVLGIGSAPSNEYNNLCLPDPFALRGTVLAFWDDLGMRDGVCVANVGMPGSYAFVIQWNNAYFYRDNTSSRLDFEVVLHQETDAIDVVYRTMSDGTEPGRGSGSMATIGIVDSFGAGTLQFGCNSPVVHAPMAIRFTPR